MRIVIRLAIPILIALSLAACTTRSELIVHNRTTVPIVFTQITLTNVVPACSSANYGWTGPGWSPRATGAPSSPPPEAVPVEIDVAPPADSTVQVTVIVTWDGPLIYDPKNEPPSLPPCAGVPPAPTPAPTRR
jgi:hypothetical protein